MTSDRWFHFGGHNVLYVRTVTVKLRFLFPKNMAIVASFWIYLGKAKFGQSFIKKCKKIMRL